MFSVLEANNNAQWSCQQSKSSPDWTQHSEWHCVAVSNAVSVYKNKFGEV